MKSCFFKRMFINNRILYYEAWKIIGFVGGRRDRVKVNGQFCLASEW